MEQQIIDIIIRIAALIVIYGVLVGLRSLKQLADAKLSAEQKNALTIFIDELTKAAEQMLKDDDLTGGKRLEYVQEQLIAAGYELTDEVRAIIEAKVYEINRGQPEITLSAIPFEGATTSD